jgi:molybdenum cofactor sulfurtransferase
LSYTGACQRWLEAGDADTRALHRAGHVCGDSVDMVDGRPTGSVRASFGYMSTRGDVARLLAVLEQHFVEARPPALQPPAPLAAGPASGEVVLCSIVVYPVKSCGGMVVQQWPLGAAGLRYDRAWALMQGARVLTQKREPLLAQIRPRVDLAQGNLVLEAPGTGVAPLALPLEGPGGEPCAGTVCGERVVGRACGPAAAAWLEDVLGLPGLQLVRGESRTSRRSRASASLANDSDCLLLSMGSVRALAARVAEGCAKHREDGGEFGEASLTRRFRGNLVVEGAPAWAEEGWAGFSSPGAEWTVAGPCRRCTMITVEQDSGAVTKEPLRALAGIKGRNFNFGVHSSLARAPGPGVQLRVGDSIIVRPTM